VKEAYARRVEEARRRIVNLADPALDALERALADKDAAVAVRAAQTVLDRVVPKPGGGSRSWSGSAPTTTPRSS
jgi:hypothetical protein